MKEFLATISRREWRLVFLMSLLLVFITTLPYIVGLLYAPAGHVYLGLHAVTPGDIPIYYSYISQIQQGQWFVKDLFTTESQHIGTFNAWWFLVAIIGNFLGFSHELSFHFSRIIMIPVFCVVLYTFIAYFFQERVVRRYAFIFSLFASGLGLWGELFANNLFQASTKSYNWLIDLWMPESSVFLTLFQGSHFIASLCLSLLIVLLLAIGFSNYHYRHVLAASVLGLLFFNFHPYHVPTFYLLIFFYIAHQALSTQQINWRYILYGFTFFVFSLPSVFYHTWLMRQEIVVLVRASQNITKTPEIIFVVVGLGFLMIGYYFAIRLFIAKHIVDRYLWIFYWLLINTFLIYSPLQFQSRYLQAISLLLTLFLFIGLLRYYREFLFKLFKVLHLYVFLFILAFFLTPVFLVSRDVYLFTQLPGIAKELLYFDNRYMALFEYLQHIPRGVVLAPVTVSLFTPAYTGNVVYFAHNHETIAPELKDDLYPHVVALLEKGEQQRARTLLLRNNIRYVVLAPNETNHDLTDYFLVTDFSGVLLLEVN